MPLPDDAVSARRERAMAAYHDELSGDAIESDSDPVDVFAEAIGAAIETATRVQVTPEVVKAASATERGFGFDLSEAIAAAFRAAGFEVTDAAA